MRRRIAGMLAVCTGLLLFPALSHAQAPFYRDKQIRLVIGWSPGGDYDLGARLVAKYMGRHIPGNPAIVPQNMPGAISINAANYLYNVAPKDGTVIGTFSRNLPAQAALGLANIRLDPRRFGWVGGAGLTSHICVATSDAPIHKFDDLFTHELLVAGIGAGSSVTLIPQMFNSLLGTKFKIVQGYASSADVILALKRGEVSGLCHSLSFLQNLYADLLTQNAVRVLVRTEETPIAGLPNIPSAFDYVKDEDQRRLLRFLTSSGEFGRPFVLPPGVPEDRLAILRTALADTLADPALQEDAAQEKIDVTYRPGADLQQRVDDIYALPKPLLDKAAALMPSD